MTSTINPNVPIPGTDLDAVQVQQNFLAAYNDINGIEVILSGLGNLSTQNQNNVTITGGSINGAALNASTVSNASLASMDAKTIKANVSASSASPSDATITQILDLVGNANGSILYRASLAWAPLAIGSDNYVLSAIGGVPTWVPAAAGGTVRSVATDSTLTGGPITISGTLGIDLTNPNTWTGHQTFNSSPIALGTATPNTALVTDGGNNVISSVTTATEIGFVSGVAAPIQTQINALAAAGYVVGPASSTDNAIARFDLATGKVIQNSGATVDDSGNLTATNFTGSSSGTNTGDQTNITGNAGTATKLQTARTINGTAFDGTANITITATPTTVGNLTDTGTDGIVITGGTGAVIGSGTSIAQHVADSTHSGYLSSTDWATFNGKSTVTPSALTKTDDTNVTLTLGGTPATALLQAASLTLGWTGTLGLSRGGTASNLSATGGTSQVLKQTSAGGVVTVGQLAASDLTNGTTGTGAVVLAGSPTITTAVLGSSTATTQSPGDNSTKLATTAYVQAAVFGTTPVGACKYATTAALTATYNNGASGVGATLTGVALGALTVDGVTPSVADRILVKNQASTFQNGIYVVTTVGNVGVAYVLTRASDYNQSTDIDIGDTTFISAGSTLANTTWTQNGTEDPVVGTDPITFTQTAGPGSYTAGNGITITGTSIAIDTAITVDKTTAQTLSNKTFVGPALGTPISGVATNLTGTAAGLTAGTVTTNANLTGVITSVGNATSIASQTGTGTKFVVDTSPTLVTPVIGAATGTSLSVSGQLTSTVAIGTAPLVVTSTTLVPNLYVARAVIADSATTNANLTGPITSIGNATSIASQTGTGTKFVVDTSPTLVTPALGVATGTSLALGGATIGTDVLGVTGTSTLNGKVTIASGTITTSTPALNITQTWNNVATVFDAPFFMNITDTASANGSGFIDIRRNNIQLFSFGRDGGNNGVLTVNNLSGTSRVQFGQQAGSGSMTLTPSAGGSTFIMSQAAATVRFGSNDVAAPIAQTLEVQNVVTGTSNTAGANFTLNGSRGTGTGAGGSIILQTAPASTTGSTQNALVTALTLASSGAATFVSTVASTGLNLSGLTASSAVATDASKNLVSVTNTGSGNNVLATSPTLVTPVLGAASATSINFGGTSLGVYAEGTFTPAIAGSATVGVGTYSVQTGQYTRIGNRVDFTAALTWSAHTGTGNMVMTGLPFTSVANVAVSFLNGSIASTASTFISLLIPSSNSVVEFFTITISTGAIGFQPIDTAAAIFISGTYFV